MSYIMYHISYIIYHISCIIYHVSYIMYHIIISTAFRLLLRRGTIAKCKTHFLGPPPLKCKIGRWTSPRCTFCWQGLPKYLQNVSIHLQCPLKNVAYILGRSLPLKRWGSYIMIIHDISILVYTTYLCHVVFVQPDRPDRPDRPKLGCSPTWLSCHCSLGNVTW